MGNDVPLFWFLDLRFWAFALVVFVAWKLIGRFWP